MKKLLSPILLLGFLLLSTSASNFSFKLNENEMTNSDQNLSGSYKLVSLLYEEKDTEKNKDEVLKNALFYSYLDGKSFIVDAKQTAQIVKYDRTKTVTLEVKGSELIIHYFKQGLASFNGANPQPADSYTVYQFAKTSNGFTISNDDPVVKESYTFTKIN